MIRGSFRNLYSITVIFLPGLTDNFMMEAGYTYDSSPKLECSERYCTHNLVTEIGEVQDVQEEFI